MCRFNPKLNIIIIIIMIIMIIGAVALYSANDITYINTLEFALSIPVQTTRHPSALGQARVERLA